MNKYYFIAPLALLLAFLFVPNMGYFSSMEEIEAKEKLHLQEIATEKAAKDARDKEIQARAEADALKRQKEHDADEQAKLEKKEREYQTAMNTLKDEADKYSNEADKFTKEGNDLEIQLSNLRTQKEKVNREAFETTKAVELAKINRRSAEMEIQRLIEIVGTKAEASTLAALPPPPPPAK